MKSMKDERIKKTFVKNVYHGGGGASYGLGFIGAAIYYISQSNSFWGGVFGLVKAVVWPVILVYQLFKHLGM